MAKKNPTKCCIAGMESTGSTYVWQLVTAVSGRKARKIHHYVRGNCMFFVSYRDPRDIICSYARRLLRGKIKKEGMEEALIKAHQILFHEFRRQDDLGEYTSDTKLKKKVFLIKYEDYFGGNEHELLDFIIKKIGGNFSDKRKEKILNKFSIENNKKISNKFPGFGKWDNRTLIHGNHISADGKIGVWKSLFTEKVCKLIKKDLGQFLIDYGYEEDLNWGIETQGSKEAS